MLDDRLLEILVDPEDGQSLFYLETEKVLFNPRLQRTYEVRNSGIPVMLVSDATTVDQNENARLMNLVQRDELKPTGGGR